MKSKLSQNLLLSAASLKNPGGTALKLVFFCLGLTLCSDCPATVIFTSNPCVFSGLGVTNDIDLDGDGRADFQISSTYDRSSFRPLRFNRVRGTDGYRLSVVAAAEIIGASVGMGQAGWIGYPVPGIPFEIPFELGRCDTSRYVGALPVCRTLLRGESANIYLGVEFESGGTLHYGWISLATPTQFENGFVCASGWAYETEQGQAVSAGAIPEPSSALLSMGAACSLMRRRRQNKGTGANQLWPGSSSLKSQASARP